ncbi:glycoside hydrolase family 15 protein [Pararhizobium mangrovi]|uniref:glycoside hydrolase family 15 protein n=1 Tax=Pararhizobium mangrovi TaxID=2590452 RepID=UPI0015E84DAC|nr:glycoside hydrolase family 15 protein [Pararhizobium mangrovi]
MSDETRQTESDFPPIRDYALIGDCRTAAVVAKSGAVEWLCLPNIDSPSIFASMLDRTRGGHFTVRMAGGEMVSRRYLEGTNVLETTFAGPDGRMTVTDFMAIAAEGGRRLDPERELVRIVDAVEGMPEAEIVCAPRPDYGREKIRIHSRARNGWAISNSGTHHFVHSDVQLELRGMDCLAGRVRLKAGERRRVIFTCATRDPAIMASAFDGDRKLDETTAWWREWLSQCRYTGRYVAQIQRSVLALKLLDFVPSGAIVAAATTSLPESIGGGRNWDYRFCWLRDASFMLRAFADTGFQREGLAFFDWLMHTTQRTQPHFLTLYDVFGRTDVSEITLDHFTGYRHSAPVRIGNAAKDQLQLDVYGEVINAAVDSIRRGNWLTPSECRLLGKVGGVVCDEWRKPDDGIWEQRGMRRHNTYSKVMCWAALHDLVELADKGVIKVDRDRFVRERDAIRAEIMERAYNAEIGAFVGAYDETFVDATALLMPRTGIIEADDPRMVSTWKRIRERLDHKGWILRYEHGTDGMEGNEGAFGICSFWAVDYLARAGELDEARARLEKLIAEANDVGLYAEEVDTETGEFLGNFPQAFTHTGFINAALALERVEEGRKPDVRRRSGKGLEHGADEEGQAELEPETET